MLCAPSLAGESFGMVLTEAFAAGTPVIASDIAGLRRRRHGRRRRRAGARPPTRSGWPRSCSGCTSSRRAARRWARAAREAAARYAWPRVAEQVEEVYEQVSDMPEPAHRTERVVAPRPDSRRSTAVPRRPPNRLPSLDPAPAQAVARHRIARRIGLGVAGALGVGLTALAAHRIGVQNVVASIVRSDAGWVLIATGADDGLDAPARRLLVRDRPRGAAARPLRRRDVTSATMIGVLMSATLPARLGEPARAMVLSRRTGRMRETFPVLLGTLVSQTALNILALALLGVIIVASTDLFHSTSQRLFIVSLAPLVLLIAVVLAPVVVRQNGSGRIARLAGAIRGGAASGPHGPSASSATRGAGRSRPGAQLAAWGIQLLACDALFQALGLRQAGIGAAAAVLFAVNVTAVVPATPSNIGVFQLAVISVLTTGFGISAADALAYGVILQAVEIATALALGLPALVREGLTWSDMRLRALSAAPVRLSPRPHDATETVSG